MKRFAITVLLLCLLMMSSSHAKANSQGDYFVSIEGGVSVFDIGPAMGFQAGYYYTPWWALNVGMVSFAPGFNGVQTLVGIKADIPLPMFPRFSLSPSAGFIPFSGIFIQTNVTYDLGRDVSAFVSTGIGGDDKLFGAKLMLGAEYRFSH